jgi:hypothetical protein
MKDILLTVAGTVAVLNIIYLFIPDGKYEKYMRVTAGLIIILTVINLVTGIEISGNTLYFDELPADYDLSALEKVMISQTEGEVSANITKKLSEKYGNVFKIENVTIENNAVARVDVRIYDKSAAASVQNEIAAYCDINKAKVVIE